MSSALETRLRECQQPYLTDTDLCAFIQGSPDSRYGKVKRLLAQGKLLHIRRGLYTIAPAEAGIHPFALAQHIYGPSYISLESALSYHQLIPEAVYTTTSVSIHRSKTFSTPIGEFSYLRVPLVNFYVGVKLVKINAQSFFIATPWKALCDYVYCYKKDWDSHAPLVDSLRIEYNDLPALGEVECDQLTTYYRHKRINRFLTGIMKGK